MIPAQNMLDALKEWAREIIPELEGGYSFHHGEKNTLLPDVETVAEDIRVVQDDQEAFPELILEQVHLRVFQVNMMICEDPRDPQQATEFLLSCVDRVTESIFSDRTCGGRVPFISRRVDASFDPPFIEFDDGTDARLVTIALFVGDPIEEDD